MAFAGLRAKAADLHGPQEMMQRPRRQRHRTLPKRYLINDGLLAARQLLCPKYIIDI